MKSKNILSRLHNYILRIYSINPQRISIFFPILTPYIASNPEFYLQSPLHSLEFRSIKFDLSTLSCLDVIALLGAIELRFSISLSPILNISIYINISPSYIESLVLNWHVCNLQLTIVVFFTMFFTIQYLSLLYWISGIKLTCV